MFPNVQVLKERCVHHGHGKNKMILNEHDLIVFLYTNNILTKLHTKVLDISTWMAKIKKQPLPPPQKNHLPFPLIFILH